MSDITICHHPACGTPRKLLGLVRNNAPALLRRKAPPDEALNQPDGEAAADVEGRRVVR